MEREFGQSVTMPRPPWLVALPPPQAVKVQDFHEQNNTGILVSRNKMLPAATERLQGILVRDQAGHYFLIANAQDAATWDRVQLFDNGQLADMESGTKIQVTGSWDEASSSKGHSAFRVRYVDTPPPGGRR